MNLQQQIKKTKMFLLEGGGINLVFVIGALYWASMMLDLVEGIWSYGISMEEMPAYIEFFKDTIKTVGVVYVYVLLQGIYDNTKKVGQK